MKYLLGIFLLASCAHSQSGNWVTLADDSGLPLAAYNPQTKTAVFYVDKEVAFKEAMEAVIKIASTPRPAPKEVKKKK